MINRDAGIELFTLFQQFKAVALVGPRQSGKTTLARAVFTEKEYVSFENRKERLSIQEINTIRAARGLK
ncbi:MAG: AAA family ATPase [Bacteroidetes bacterium]|jgi:uncharacterized protein|nr:AAA family ATPase [Bacteroidota bacterium]MBT4399147.1 AAA family ATPase [Bacteroidota bacterium]MBT4410785.1 AAA family ATPase [Bacteroidota bacterium]MBT5426055.1 AAA family ATPase [Bacteroidota bacterium]MBT7462435.1 AAA family ATPase [Bacteroidota bacterium]